MHRLPITVSKTDAAEQRCIYASICESACMTSNQPLHFAQLHCARARVYKTCAVD